MVKTAEARMICGFSDPKDIRDSSSRIGTLELSDQILEDRNVLSVDLPSGQGWRDGVLELPFSGLDADCFPRDSRLRVQVCAGSGLTAPGSWTHLVVAGSWKSGRLEKFGHDEIRETGRWKKMTFDVPDFGREHPEKLLFILNSGAEVRGRLYMADLELEIK